MRLGLMVDWDTRQLIRERWLAGLSLIFGGLAIAVAAFTGGGSAVAGVDPFQRTAVALALLMTLFVPLVALILGSTRLAGAREEGVLAYLLAQPLGRGDLYFGYGLSVAAVVTMTVLLGFGGAGLLLAWRGTGDPAGFLLLCLLSLLLAYACLGCGMAVASVSSSKSRALGAALVLWFFFVVAADLILLGAAMTWRLDPWWFLGLAGLSPGTLFRLGVTVGITGAGDLAGPVGVVAVSRLGVSGTVALVALALTLWAAAGTLAGWLLFNRRAEP